jgi:hypothetical protein
MCNSIERTGKFLLAGVAITMTFDEELEELVSPTPPPPQAIIQMATNAIDATMGSFRDFLVEQIPNTTENSITPSEPVGAGALAASWVVRIIRVVEALDPPLA